MQSKVVLITGANSGIGLATSIGADLSQQAHIRRLADTFRDRFRQLDVPINNAALIRPQREETAEGLEVQFAVNHLAYFTLTIQLLDLLLSSGPAHIVNVSTELTRSMNGIVRAFAQVVLMKTPERGAWTTLYLASAPQSNSVTGRYFHDNCNQVEPSETAQNGQIAARLWDVNLQLAQLPNPAL